ncbi:MAG: DUF262 domain-containing protein [Bacteroidetes bacterium]|nr:DUF262 domain-containing protein [Bacteroidota bacterium]
MPTSIRQFDQNLRIYGIPEFQRDFEWRREKIEKFWDSIYRKYPLPIFFTWQVGQNSPVGLTRFTSRFRNFTPIYSNDDRFNEGNYGFQTTAICDGQQRLTSILIGIKGFNLGTNRTPKFLYFNPFTEIYNDENVINHNASYFKILNNTEVSRRNIQQNDTPPTEYWIKVSDFYDFLLNQERNGNLGTVTIINSCIDHFFTARGVELTVQQIINVGSVFREFYSQLSNHDYLNFFELSPVINNSLEKADEFFIRINSGSPMKPDSKLFALLTRFIPPDGNINLKADFADLEGRYCELFTQKIKPNFFLRACLYFVTNNVLFNIDSFNRDNCTIIINSWENIKLALVTTFDTIKKLGLSRSLSSLNSTIPVAFHFFKMKTINPNYEFSTEDKTQILKYFLRLEFSGYFGGEHGDSKLRRIKSIQSGIQYNVNTNFDLLVHNNKLPPNENFDINDFKIDKILNTEYGDPICRPLLHLIYPGLLTTVNYELDHIQPQSKCSNRENLLNLRIDPEVVNFIHQTFNKISNIQLIPQGPNRNKSDKNIYVWVTERIEAEDWNNLNGFRTHEGYFSFNFIEASAENDFYDNMSLTKYVRFYNDRKKKIKSLIKDML